MLLFSCCQFEVMFDGNGQKRSLLLLFLELVLYNDQLNLETLLQLVLAKEKVFLNFGIFSFKPS